MPTSAQVRGMLLEEALLYLLRNSGYKTIEDFNNDETLQRGSAGIELKGRGGVHQIDAIAEYVVTPPFSYPQRLLVEAKSFLRPNQKVGIQVVRNAVGVLKDVNEYWVSRGQHLSNKRRFHYQFAIFSSNGYTIDAERYSFAHDIYLIPLANSTHFQPINRAIQNFNDNELVRDLSEAREVIRLTLRSENEIFPNLAGTNPEGRNLLQQFIHSCRIVGYAMLAVLDKRFPVFLVPNPNINIAQLPDTVSTRIYWDENGWYLNRANPDEELFSFDIPFEMIKLYTEGKILKPERAVDLKIDHLSEIQAIVSMNNRIRLITFRLDEDWIRRIRRRIGRKQ